MDNTGWNETKKTPTYPLATKCPILPEIIQVSAGELAEAFSNAACVKYLA